jgi:hypothetical protein
VTDRQIAVVAKVKKGRGDFEDSIGTGIEATGF